MFAYCNNNPVNFRDSDGNISEPSLLDYGIIHKGVQMDIVAERGYAMEVYVKGPDGRGFLDLYDASTNQYYEVKSVAAAGTAGPQMKKYDTATIASWMFIGYKIDMPPQRGVDISIQGSFIYKDWYVSYQYSAPGLIIYTVTPNRKETTPNKAPALVPVMPVPSSGKYGKCGTWGIGGRDVRFY